MRTYLSIAWIALAVVMRAWASEAKFIKLYDSGKYDEAAKLLDEQLLDTTNPAVARRLGVMYYKAMGIKENQAKGRALLEKAMMAGDATAAVNLAKIYFKNEKNSPKAAWCLLVAETAVDDSIKEEVSKLKTRFGEEYKRGVRLYIQQLQTVFNGTLDSLKTKTSEYEKALAVLRQQIADMNEERKSLDAQFKEINDKLTRAERAKKEQEEQIEKVKESNADLRKKSDEQVAASDEKLNYELGQARKRYDELKAEHIRFVKEKYGAPSKAWLKL